MSTQSENFEPVATGARNPDEPFVDAAHIATVLNLAYMGEYEDSSDELSKDVGAIAAEIVRLRHKLGINDLSQLAEHLFWGEMSCAAACIEDATPDPKFRRVLQVFLDQHRLNREGLDLEVLAQEANVSAEDARHYADELVAARILEVPSVR